MKKTFLTLLALLLTSSCVNKEEYIKNSSTPSSRINEIQSGGNSVLKDLDE